MQQNIQENQPENQRETQHERLQRLRAESSKLQREVRSQTVGYIVGALGLVAGLAWNDAIRALIDHFFPTGNNSLPAKFGYAALITLLVVILTVWLLKLKGKQDKENS